MRCYGLKSIKLNSHFITMNITKTQIALEKALLLKEDEIIKIIKKYLANIKIRIRLAFVKSANFFFSNLIFISTKNFYLI